MPSVAGKHIVLIGDSLSASPSAPGGVLVRELRSKGASVTVNAKVGRSAYGFISKEDLSQIPQLMIGKPSIAIIMLGTNDTGYQASTVKAGMEQIKNELERYGATVYAIGPPLFGGHAVSANVGRPVVVETMRSLFGGRFIDAGPATADLISKGRTGDGIHFDATGGEIAGVRLAKSFQSASSVSPILIGAAAALALVLLVTRR